jgi:hypothetical protein
MRARQLIGPLYWRIEFKPQDLWIGAYWKRNEACGGDMAHDIWVCLLPMVPLHFQWRIRPRRSADPAR